MSDVNVGRPAAGLRHRIRKHAVMSDQGTPMYESLLYGDEYDDPEQRSTAAGIAAMSPDCGVPVRWEDVTENEAFDLYEGMDEVVPGVFVDGGDGGATAVYIADERGEVVTWNSDEVKDSGGDAFSAALNAVTLAAALGPAAVRENLANGGGTLRGLVARTSAPPPPAPTLYVALEGGVVQDVVSDQPERLVGVTVKVIDYDNPDVGHDDRVSDVRQADGSVAKAYVQSEPIGKATISLVERGAG